MSLKDQTRVNVYVDNDILREFDKLHPMQGARTRFVRKAFTNYLKAFKKSADNILDLEERKDGEELD